ncbi:MAG TPA: NAD-dependent epimerase/dehydratase family protein, partial [Bryobacteraceae bacterium]|nr:NAD-dependent epimerase/dehydratase family protein [Bryobacteraceae bacterium]
YRSTDIHQIAGKHYDRVICAGAPAVKWKANKEPEADLKNLQHLMNNLAQMQSDRFVLISTVDVYRDPRGVDESTSIDVDQLEPYGKHRYMLEQFVNSRFPAVTTIRLPGLFGAGLKKNAIYDLMRDNALHLIHKDSAFQFYNMQNLYRDIEIALDQNLSLVNFATEPVRVADVARKAFDRDFDNVTEKPPIFYDMQTRMGAAFGRTGPYLYSAEETFSGIRAFVEAERQTA